MARVYEHVRTAGPFVFVAGQTPQLPSGEVPDGVAEQVRVVVAKIAGLLEGHGADLSHVVRMTYFLTRVGDLGVVRSALDQVLPHPRPAATLVEVSGLIDPRYRVEIDAIAYREP